MRPMFCVLNTKTLKRLHILGCGSIWKHWHQWYHSKAYNFIVQWHDESYITSHAYYSKKNYRNIDENLSKSWRVLPRNKDKRQEGKKQNDDMRITKKKKKKGKQEYRHYLSNLYPCKRDSARIVFVEVARQPNKAAQNPNILKLSSVTDVRRIPPTMGTKEAQIRQSKYFLQTSHCKTTVQNPLYQMQLGYNLRIIIKSKDENNDRCYPYLKLTCGSRSEWLYCLHKRNWDVT